MQEGLSKNIEEELKNLKHINVDEDDLIDFIIDKAHAYF